MRRRPSYRDTCAHPGHLPAIGVSPLTSAPATGKDSVSTRSTPNLATSVCQDVPRCAYLDRETCRPGKAISEAAGGVSASSRETYDRAISKRDCGRNPWPCRDEQVTSWSAAFRRAEAGSLCQRPRRALHQIVGMSVGG